MQVRTTRTCVYILGQYINESIMDVSWTCHGRVMVSALHKARCNFTDDCICACGKSTQYSL